MLIGITGGIGAGKSVVSRILRLKGYEVYDCDSRARRLMENDPAIFGRLIARYGAEVMCESGCLNRAMLAEKVFAIAEERLWLNALVHKAVCTDIQSLYNQQDKNICFVESAIMVTSGLDKMCSRIWLVDAPVELRRERALGRGGITAENLELRIKSQMAEFDGLPENKVRVILNDGSHSLLSRIGELLNENNYKNNTQLC